MDLYHERLTHLGKKATFFGRPYPRLFFLAGGVFFAYFFILITWAGFHMPLKTALICGVISMIPAVYAFARPVSDNPLHQRIFHHFRARRLPRFYVALPDKEGWSLFLRELGFFQSKTTGPVKTQDNWIDE